MFDTFRRSVPPFVTCDFEALVELEELDVPANAAATSRLAPMAARPRASKSLLYIGLLPLFCEADPHRLTC